MGVSDVVNRSCQECGSTRLEAPYTQDPRTGRASKLYIWCVPCYERIVAAAAREDTADILEATHGPRPRWVSISRR